MIILYYDMRAQCYYFEQIYKSIMKVLLTIGFKKSKEHISGINIEQARFGAGNFCWDVLHCMFFFASLCGVANSR